MKNKLVIFLTIGLLGFALSGCSIKQDNRVSAADLRIRWDQYDKNREFLIDKGCMTKHSDLLARECFILFVSGNTVTDEITGLIKENHEGDSLYQLELSSNEKIIVDISDVIIAVWINEIKQDNLMFAIEE